MNPLATVSLPQEFLKDRICTRLSYLVILFILMFSASGVWAQTVTWTDSFEQGKTPTEEQCRRWSDFLASLQGKSFASVHLSGQYDAQGKTIADPQAATQLAALLASKSEGTVTSNGSTWTVTHCDLSNCLDGFSISLAVDGNTEECSCSDLYALRPQSRNQDWGGINTGTSCNAKSQFMKLEFHSGVSIISDGDASLCQGGSVVLTAQAEICSSPQQYLWSTGETTPSITVSKAGSYTVTVSDASGCSGTSSAFTVTGTETSVDAGDDVVICEEPAQLNAVGMSAGGGVSSMVNAVCLFDSPGMIGQGLCNFVTANVCLEGQTPYGNASFSKEVDFRNPVELRYKLYYSADWIGDFFFKVNGVKVGGFHEGDPTSACEVIGSVRAPRTFIFSADQFKHLWKDDESNVLSIDIEALDGAILLSGLVAEVVTSEESFMWSPAAGLNVASIANPLAQPDETTIYTVTYTDANGCVATDQVEVKVQCASGPVAVCKELSVSAKENCVADISAGEFDGGSTSPTGAAFTFSVAPAGPYQIGTTDVIFTVTDADGQSASCTTTVTVTDETPPVIATLEDIMLSNDPGTCAATFELALPEVSDNCGIETITRDFDGTVFPEGETAVTWTVKDIHGNESTATQMVVVTNTAPVIESVAVSASPVIVNSEVILTVTSADNNAANATVTWDDGSEPETVPVSTSVFELSHTYAEARAYSVTITLTDACGATTYHYENITVINNRIGSVSGGGWFDSPGNAYLYNPRARGKATFAFEASNDNRYNRPEGHINFNFNDANIKFRSTDIESLDVSENRAGIKGTGRLNGKKGYVILVSVLEDDKEKGDDDGRGGNDNDNKGKDKKKDKDKGKKSLDQIRVKIWDPSGKVIYDTQPGQADQAVPTTPLGGGSINVKPAKSRFDHTPGVQPATSFGEESASAYPNPFETSVDLQFNSGSQDHVLFVVMDLSGKVVYNKVFAPSEDGHYSLHIFEEGQGRPGIYIVVIKQGRRVEFVRMVRK